MVTKEKCEWCDGIGISECDECVSEIECPDCNGSGKVNIGRQEYNKQLVKDKKAVEEFLK